MKRSFIKLCPCNTLTKPSIELLSKLIAALPLLYEPLILEQSEDKNILYTIDYIIHILYYGIYILYYNPIMQFNKIYDDVIYIYIYI